MISPPMIAAFGPRQSGQTTQTDYSSRYALLLPQRDWQVAEGIMAVAGHVTRRIGIDCARGRGGAVVGAILLGLFCGIVARMLIPNDAFQNLTGPKSWLVSLVLGLVGALVGYVIFTVGLGIGDTDIFDWGGVLSALIGTVIVALIATWFMRRMSHRTKVG
jgi:uncharacterized membrane protein YeaQ/YmgE (transglycosylase-associated protein family)